MTEPIKLHEGATPEPPVTARSWDMGDPEPEGVNVVRDYTHDAWDDDAHSSWGRTTRGEWKGYKDGGKVYVDWAELVRRWGPVTEVTR